jgi:hypothetical protein
MARIIVTPDQNIPGAAPVLLDESVYSVHLSTGHAAMQLIERLSWALNDAEAIERARPNRIAPRRQRNRRGGSGRTQGAPPRQPQEA